MVCASALNSYIVFWPVVQSSLLFAASANAAITVLAAPVLALAAVAAVAAEVAAADADAAAAPGARATSRRVRVRARRPAPTHRRCAARRPAQWPCWMEERRIGGMEGRRGQR